MSPISEADKERYPAIEAFYKTVGEEVTFDTTERVVIAEEGERIIGSARLVREHDRLVLRTVNVDPAYQRKGVGTGLVKKICEFVGEEPCYCLPYPHLKHFYESFGFKEVEEESLPPFLAERLTEYNRSFPSIAMRRN